jgi:hypothetical protein
MYVSTVSSLIADSARGASSVGCVIALSVGCGIVRSVRCRIVRSVRCKIVRSVRCKIVRSVKCKIVSRVRTVKKKGSREKNWSPAMPVPRKSVLLYATLNPSFKKVEKTKNAVLIGYHVMPDALLFQ